MRLEERTKEWLDHGSEHNAGAGKRGRYSFLTRRAMGPFTQASGAPYRPLWIVPRQTPVVACSGFVVGSPDTTFPSSGCCTFEAHWNSENVGNLEVFVSVYKVKTEMPMGAGGKRGSGCGVRNWIDACGSHVRNMGILSLSTKNCAPHCLF